MGIFSKLSTKVLGKTIKKLNKEIADAKKVKGIKGAKEEFKLKDKNEPLKKEMEKRVVKKLETKLEKAKEKKKSLTNKKSEKKDKLDPTPSSPRSAIVQAQRYKKIQSGLEKEYTNTLDRYNKLKDKKSETAMLMVRKLNLMSKKIKGKKQIPMLPEGKAKGGMSLKQPTGEQVGLKKLPTPVRNKMGYMRSGGIAKKPKMGNMDYRKGGMVIIALDMKKKGKGK